MRALHILALICLLGLGGCSYRFDVRAVMIDGRLAFISTGRFPEPECVSRVMIRDVDAGTAQTYESWIQSAFVWVDVGGYDCTDRFPLFYGVPLKGEDADQSAPSTEVAPKELRVGAIYEVMIISGATGYGGGRFRLLPDGGVENLGRAMLTGEDAPSVPTAN